ncbi:enolase C-terminal domain-like protein [Stutzerimonas tarimensis]|uniref:Enolase C-terminal domain-like protein n=1 Tax=Stutzerimonas tarimensis TaxID=1507735 RepID=A0ABV7T3X9_9GAMM
MARLDIPVTAVRASAYRIPTDQPEADGTLAWNATTLVVVEVDAGGHTGLGYTYADAALLPLIDRTLRGVIEGGDVMSPSRTSEGLWHAVRNLGRSGLAACAISAIDTALWDLKARVLGLSLAALLGPLRDRVPVYGSGGFTAYDDGRLREQLGGWAEQDGCRWVKMKIGGEPSRELARIEDVLEAIGEATLFVDANGAYSSRQAIALATQMADLEIGWFEEPVSSDDLQGLLRVRTALDAAGTPMDVAAGEYAYTLDDFRHLLQAGAVDVLQADLTRCGGVTGFMQAAALCESFHVGLSAHCAPALHLPVACAAPRLLHQEWFHDHARIEALLFDGAPRLQQGHITPDLDAPGHGLQFRHADAQRHII